MQRGRGGGSVPAEYKACAWHRPGITEAEHRDGEGANGHDVKYGSWGMGVGASVRSDAMLLLPLQRCRRTLRRRRPSPRGRAGGRGACAPIRYSGAGRGSSRAGVLLSGAEMGGATPPWPRPCAALRCLAAAPRHRVGTHVATDRHMDRPTGGRADGLDCRDQRLFEPPGSAPPRPRTSG